jgi:hypothetical protein
MMNRAHFLGARHRFVDTGMHELDGVARAIRLC